MAYLGIDRRRFEYVLSLGADEFELRRFFIENRTMLIQHGGRVQNIPQGLKARVHTLAFELPTTTDGDVQSWFGKHLTMVDPEEPARVVEEFTLYEELREPMPENNARRLARSCLVHLFSDKPPFVLTEFLRTPMGGVSRQKGVAEEPAQTVPALPTPTAAWIVPSGLSKLLVDLVEGHDVDEDLADLPPEFGTFVSGLQAGQLGRREDARAMAAALQDGSVLRLSLEAFLKRRDARRNENSVSVKGLRTQDESSFSGEFFSERDEVLGYCTNASRPSAVFVKPLAIVRPGQVLFLSDDDARSIFPDTGDLIAFPGSGHPRQPVRGEIGVWKVEEHDTEKRTRFHLVSDKRSVFEARMVPFPSTDYDSVREYLKELSSRTERPPLNPYVYQLSDGLVVACRPDRADLNRDETFELGLLEWESLPALRFDGRLFVIGPLPKEQSIYECGSLAFTAKNLFRNKIGNGAAAGLTKAQLRDLAQSLGNGESELTGQRIARLSAELLRLADQREVLDVLVESVAQRAEVRSRIDQVIEFEAAKELAVRTDLQGDIERLQKERAEWEERIRKQRDEHRRLRDETTKVVRSAFDRARNEGMPKLLADAAIFQALSTSVGLSPAQPVASTSVVSPRTSPRELLVAPSDAVTALRKFGVAKQRATAFSALSKAVHGAGLMLFVKGTVARPAVEAWAAALGARGTLFDVSVGLIDDEVVRAILGSVPPPEVVVLFDANLSALDIYGRSLTDLAITNIARSATVPMPATFMVLSEGLGALPVPRTFEQLSVEIDLERRYEFRDAAYFEGMTLESGAEAEHPSLSRLWELGARRLSEEIDKLQPEDRALALSVLLAEQGA
ncbi:hypothetical protein [Paraburkholderia sp.]|uniref:hypothetical protein n=1 Tax=Paraburkholderia sp. TaxID=1926495 RepID=UPI003D6E3838